MHEKLIDKIPLDNGLTLELWDRSRQVAGDRWLVRFVACIAVPVDSKYFEQEENESLTLDGVRTAIGEQAVYSRQKQSRVVDAQERNREVDNLKNTVLATNLGYLSSPDFPRKLIIKAYRESQGQGVHWKPG